MSSIMSAFASRETPLTRIVPGLTLCVVLAVLAFVGGEAVRVVGPPVFAVLLGALVRVAYAPPSIFLPGISFASKKVLQLAVVTSGFGISIAGVLHTGVTTLPVMLGTVAIALVAAPIVGRALGVSPALHRLIGVGTAICGASAIAAVAAVVESSEADVALAMATIFLYNLAAVVVFPPIGHALHLTQTAFGTWAGTAVNDTSSVLAAGYAYGPLAGRHATIVKLSRATLILPIAAAFAIARLAGARAQRNALPWRSIVPWFIVWFFIATLVNGTGIIPPAWDGAIGRITLLLVAVALAGVGLQTDLDRFRTTGGRPLLLGLLLWACVAISSLVIGRETGVAI
jgi:uncharacterized integral membrane protein (TIGR00698 family)